MPKLNTANPEVQAYLLEIARYWIEEYDIDAWRLDVANEVDHAFWKNSGKHVMTQKKILYFRRNLALVAKLAPRRRISCSDELCIHRCDYGLLCQARTVLEKMLSEMNNQLMLYRQQTNQMQFNVLDSHDTPRLLHETKEDKELMRQVLAFTYIQPGVPCLYYGDEIGMTGDMDPDCRRCMVWEENQQDLI